MRRTQRGDDRDRRGRGLTTERSADDVRARAEQSGGNFDSIFLPGVDVFTPKQGENVVRFLPPTWDDHKHYAYDVFVHAFVGPNKDSYICLAKMKKEHCPICETVKEMRKAGEDEDDIKRMEPKKRCLAYVLEREGDDPLRPKIWNFGWQMDRDIAALAYDRRKGSALYLDDKEEGYDFVFKRKGTRLNTEYFGLKIDNEPSPLAKKDRDVDDIMDHIDKNPIPDILKFHDADYLESVMSGSNVERDKELESENEGREAREDARRERRGRGRDDDEDDRRSSRRGGRDREDDEEDRSSRRGSSRRESLDEDEDRGSRRSSRGRDREEEDEEDRRPSRRSGRDAEDEEQDERPSRRGRGRDDDEEERPSRRSRGRDDEEATEEEDERPTGRRGRTDRTDDEDERPSRRASNGRGRDKDEEPEEDERPTRGRGGSGKGGSRSARDDDEEDSGRRSRR